MNMKMLGDRVLVVLSAVEKVSQGIILPDVAQRDAVWGTVDSVGPHVKDLKAGDGVYVSRHAGTKFINRRDGVPCHFVILREPEILARDDSDGK